MTSHRRPADMRRVEALEARLGKDILTAWRECCACKMSQADIAEDWGICTDTLREWRRHFGFPPVKQVYRLQPFGADVPGSLDDRARKLGHASFQAYAYSRNSDGWTRKQMAAELGVRRNYIGMWFTRNMIDPPPPVRTEAQRLASQANIQKARECRNLEKHPFRVQL